MNWPQANRFITWQHIHKASSIQRKESWATVTEDTKKCTDPKLMSLAINRLNLLPNGLFLILRLPEEYKLSLIGSSKFLPQTFIYIQILDKKIFRIYNFVVQRKSFCNMNGSSALNIASSRQMNTIIVHTINDQIFKFLVAYLGPLLPLSSHIE